MSSVSSLPAWPAPIRLPMSLRWAIAASVAAHGLALLVQVGLPSAPPDSPPSPLHVLLRAARPDPAPATVETAPAPARPPEPITRPVPPRPESTARPVAALTRPVSPERPAPARVRSETPVPTPVPAISLAAEAPAALPARPAIVPAEPVAVVPHHAPAVATDEAPDPALLERYGRSLSSLFARQQQYPRLAALRGWEGEVQVRVTIARRGNIVATQIVRSSGFEVLDQNAIQLVASSGPLPRPPEALQNKELQIIVPVLFKLEKPT